MQSDGGLNTEEMMKEAKKRVAVRKQHKQYSIIKKMIGGIPCCSAISEDKKSTSRTAFAQLDEKTAALNTLWDIQALHILGTSKSKILRPLVLKIRRMLQNEVRFGLDPVVTKQVNFNVKTLEAFIGIVDELKRIDSELHKLRIDMRDLKETLDNMKREIERSIPISRESLDYGIYNNPSYWNGDHSIRIMDSYETTEGVFNAWAKKLATLIPMHSVLDIACGYGYLVKAFNDLGIEAHGVDISKYAVSKGKEIGIPNVIEASAEHLPYTDNYFDLVINMELSAHLPLDTFLHAVREMYRTAKRYVFILLEAISESNGIRDAIHIDKTHRTFLTLAQYYEFLKPYKRDRYMESVLNSEPQSTLMRWSPNWVVLEK